jgi:hypothetical protein
MVSEITHLIRCIDIYGLGLLQKKFTSVSVLVSGPCLLYHNFYCIFSCYLALAKPGLGYLNSCNYTDMGCPVIVVRFSKVPNSVSVSPSPEDGYRSNFQNVVFSSFLEPPAMEKSKNPVILNVIHHRQNPLESTIRKLLQHNLIENFCPHLQNVLSKLTLLILYHFNS